jgi:hypothetical protein
MQKSLSVTLVTLLFLMSLAALPTAASAQAGTTGLTVPITGTSASGLVSGTLTVTRFAASGGGIAAIGTLVALLPTGQTAVQQIAIPIDLTLTDVLDILTSPGTCDILHLVLGPLDLDLLGLQVHLNQVVLDIVAQTGAGNLLGNLLCAIAGLLDQGGPLARLANLLNDLLRILT